jgi:hypothetical protein
MHEWENHLFLLIQSLLSILVLALGSGIRALEICVEDTCSVFLSLDFMIPKSYLEGKIAFAVLV